MLLPNVVKHESTFKRQSNRYSLVSYDIKVVKKKNFFVSFLLKEYFYFVPYFHSLTHTQHPTSILCIHTAFRFRGLPYQGFHKPDRTENAGININAHDAQHIKYGLYLPMIF